MNIFELLYELLVISDIEVVIALLPEMSLSAPLKPAFGLIGLILVLATSSPTQSPRHTLLQRLDRLSKGLHFGFTQEQMHVVRHHHICVHAQSKSAADSFKGDFKLSSARLRSEQALVLITRESHEVALARVLKAL